MKRAVLPMLAALASPAGAAVTFESANVGTTAFARVTGGAVTSPAGDGSDPAGVPTAPVTSSVQQADFSRSGSAAASASASAAFAGGGSVEVAIGALTASATLLDGGAGDAGASAFGQFLYSFSVDRASELTLAYADLSVGPAFFYRVSLRPFFGNDYLLDAQPQDAFGTLTASLAAGRYDLVVNGRNGRVASAPGTDGGTAPAARFSLSIADAALPEPATWTLMLAGFGLVGAGTRQRGRGIAAT